MERETALYNFLVDNYKDDKYYSKYEICESLSKYYEYDPNETRICREIEADVARINFSASFDKIIVSNKKGYKIGNKEQVKEYINRLYKRDLKSLAKTSVLRKKNSRDGQTVADEDFSEVLSEINVYIH